MPPRRRPQFTQENVEQQLQQIHLLDQSSSSENLEQLGPIIKQIHTNRQQDAYLRTLQALIDSKDAEIEKICGDNYQDFISAVSTLFTVKSYTHNLRDKIGSLDSSVSQLGRGLAEKKRALLQSKKTATNLDEAIDSLQASLRVLDVVDRVGEMVKEGKYWSALRSLEDIQSMPQSSLSQTPLFQHILMSLPSLRGQIKDAVTASTKQWLLEIRNLTGDVGKLALEAMENRTRRWRSRREKDPTIRLSRVGSAVETVSYETTDDMVLETLKVDFSPLYQSIHIYSTLDSLDELRKSYQADRKAQSDLILPVPLQLPSLVPLTEQIIGFFIIESHVLQTTGSFRSKAEVEELWDAIAARLAEAVDDVLRNVTDPDSYLHAKETLIAFILTLEAYQYSTSSLHAAVFRLFERYATLLERQFSKRFKDIVVQDDYQPMHVDKPTEKDAVLKVVWLSSAERAELSGFSTPLTFPWSQSFYLCCEDIRDFVQRFYQFIEGVSQHHRNVDELLSKSLDTILSDHVSDSYCDKLAKTSTLSQVAQIITNLEHFEVACAELERTLTTLRSAQRGGTIRLTAATSFAKSQTRASARITAFINSKLDDFFGLSEYDWTPATREDAPSMYLYELVNWLTTVVDSLQISDAYKDEAYRAATAYIAQSLTDLLTDRNIPVVNENAIANILVDLDFLEEQFRGVGRADLVSLFTELRSMTSLVMSDSVTEYLVPSLRQTRYVYVKPKRLTALLEKLARYGASCRDQVSREKGEKRRKEADAVGRLFPGENR
ncbi:exocyst complex component sec15 subunit [Russula earlei]|uniref:Exocyst complex component sec15 subunit n=1 Tax=Russula earlei TaxID=71964 RepID=A0ACC0U7A8_9AGAM|nr:exocyst complex component sec15 subunit [Russula earlei]